MTVPQMYQLAAQRMGSRDRTWKMNRSADDLPLPKIAWRMTIIDVAQNSQDEYCALIKQWAHSIWEQMAPL